MKVWVVLQLEMDYSSIILGVFSDEQKADALVATKSADKSNKPSCFDKDGPYELDVEVKP